MAHRSQEEIGQMLKSLREQNSLTVAQAADLGHITVQHLQAMESGQDITVTHLHRMAGVYGIVTSQLLTSDSIHDNPTLLAAGPAGQEIIRRIAEFKQVAAFVPRIDR